MRKGYWEPFLLVLDGSPSGENHKHTRLRKHIHVWENSKKKFKGNEILLQMSIILTVFPFTAKPLWGVRVEMLGKTLMVPPPPKTSRKHYQKLSSRGEPVPKCYQAKLFYFLHCYAPSSYVRLKINWPLHHFVFSSILPIQMSFL